MFGVIYVLMKRFGGQVREFFDNRAQVMTNKLFVVYCLLFVYCLFIVVYCLFIVCCLFRLFWMI